MDARKVGRMRSIGRKTSSKSSDKGLASKPHDATRQRVVCIVAEEPAAVLRAHPDLGRDIMVFVDTEAVLASQRILQHRPHLVLLHREFLATSRGAALVGRIKTDPSLSHTQIRVLSEASQCVQLLSRRVRAGLEPSPAMPGDPLPSDYQGVRQVVRFRMAGGLAVQVNGNHATLVDLSRDGAQLRVPMSVRLNEHVRITVTDDEAMFRCRASVVWATFERPGDTGGPWYRAGVAFMDADRERMDAFARRHQEL